MSFRNRILRLMAAIGNAIVQSYPLVSATRHFASELWDRDGQATRCGLAMGVVVGRWE
jgi:hypothetical protein